MKQSVMAFNEAFSLIYERKKETMNFASLSKSL